MDSFPAIEQMRHALTPEQVKVATGESLMMQLSPDQLRFVDAAEKLIDERIDGNNAAMNHRERCIHGTLRIPDRGPLHRLMRNERFRLILFFSNLSKAAPGSPQYVHLANQLPSVVDTYATVLRLIHPTQAERLLRLERTAIADACKAVVAEQS